MAVSERWRNEKLLAKNIPVGRAGGFLILVPFTVEAEKAITRYYGWVMFMPCRGRRTSNPQKTHRSGNDTASIPRRVKYLWHRGHLKK